MNTEVSYVVRRNVGTVGRPNVACAVCNFSPSGHVLAALPPFGGPAEADKGLCNVHAQGLSLDDVVSASQLEAMGKEWRAAQRST